MYQEDEKREPDFWSRHFVNATRKCLVLNIKYRGKFCNKKAQTFSFSRNLVINNHVHFSIHPPSLNKSVHLGPRLLSIKNKRDSKTKNAETAKKPLQRALQQEFYKYGSQGFYKQLMDILYVNDEEILLKTSLFNSGRRQEKTLSSWSVIWVKYPAGAHTVCGKLRSKKPRLEKTATTKDSHRTTKNCKCESWSDDSEP